MKAGNLRGVGVLAIFSGMVCLSAYGQPMRPIPFPPPPPLRQEYPKFETQLPKPIGLTPTLKDIPSAPQVQRIGNSQIAERTTTQSSHRPETPAPSANSSFREESRHTSAPTPPASIPAPEKSEGIPRWLLVGGIAVAVAYFLGKSSSPSKAS